VQADAGALAAGGLFNPCKASTTGGSTATANAAITAETKRYGGDPSVAQRFNDQVGVNKKGTVTLLINSKTFQVGGPGPDDTVEQQPCEAKMVDVKMTEADLPLFFGIAKGLGAPVPAINATARVQIKQRSGKRGSLPIAVPDVNPVAAAALFVSEPFSSGSVPFAATDLTDLGPQNRNGKLLEIWSHPVNVTVPNGSANNGVIIALAGTAGWNVNNFTSMTLGQICGTATQVGLPSVTCFPRVDPTFNFTQGLVHVRGYSAGAGNPGLGSVTLDQPGCGDNSAPYFILNGSCSARVNATITGGAATMAVRVQGPGCSGQGCGMNLVGGEWRTGCGGNPSFGPENEWEAVTVRWKATTGGPASCGGSGGGFNNFAAPLGSQRAFSDDDADDPELSGPVDHIVLSANSLQQGSSTSVNVEIGLEGKLALSGPGGPPVVLRVADPSGSQNQAIDCDAGVNFRDEIANGCKTPYQRNCTFAGPVATCPKETCPNATLPLDCAAIETGDKVGQLRQGMNDRLGQGGSCAPNNWSKYPTPGIPQGDKRAIPLILTQFGSFSNNGNGWVPVMNFAVFYVTGWDGSNCADNEAFPGKKKNDKGDIWGHFIQYTDGLNDGGASDADCDYNALGICVAVLTR
jgi:hypothetical protein